MMSHLRLLGIDHHHASSYWSRLVSPIPTHNKNLASSSFSFSFSNSLFLISSPAALLPSSPPNPISISFRIPSLSALPLQFQQELVDSPVSVDLIPICSDALFHQLIAQTQHPLIIVWMANWCRNCIYLKPKLEKLAAEYYPRLRFYGVDVNAVSHKLVAHAGVTKMPTIQLWKDGKKQAEVIGGRKAYWVIGDVQEMIENECTT